MIKIRISCTPQDYHRAAAIVAAIRSAYTVRKLRTPERDGDRRRIYLDIE